MTKMRSIEIDIDVHKLIEQKRVDFEETPNDVLRRILNLNAPLATQSEMAVPALNQNGREWRSHGVVLPHGTQARFRYNDRIHEAVIDNGRWSVEDGSKHKTPSGAAIKVARTKEESPTNLNGWNLWEVKRPGEASWTHLRQLRK